MARHGSGIGRVVDGECDGAVAIAAHIPCAVRPVVWSTVQGVCTIVLGGVVGHISQGELAVTNAVGITARNRVVDGVVRVDG